MKKKITALALLLLCSCLLAGCHLNHQWLEATCLEPVTCSTCGKTKDAPLGHDWTEVLCSRHSTCTRCSAIGDIASHIWTDPTCISPKTCTVCGIVGSNQLADHQWTEATADTPKTCSVCGKQSGFTLNEDKENSYNHYLNDAEQLVKDGRFREAIQLLDNIWEQTGKEAFYNRASEYRFDFGRHNTSRLAAGENNSAILNSDGTVTVVGRNDHGELAAGNWTKIRAISLGDKHIVGLKTDGTVVAAGSNTSGRSNVGSWKNVVAVSAGNSHTVALTDDGKVLATGYDEYGQCQVQTLMDAAGNKKILSVAAGYYHTVALLEDGTAVACGDSRFNACSVRNWTDLAAIYAGSMYTAGLKTDGTVVVTGQYTETWNTSRWTDIVNLAAGDSYLIGLKADGTVVSAGFNSANLIQTHRPVESWKEIVHISAGFDQTLAVNASGKILCAGVNNFGQCDLANSLGYSTPQSVLPSTSSTAKSKVDHVEFDHFYEYRDEYVNIVGMTEKDEPIWIYMTEHYGTAEDHARIHEIGKCDNLYFLFENSTVIALDYTTGQVVWKHQDINGDFSGIETDSNENMHITGYSHDIYVSSSGEITCANNHNNCKQHGSVKPATPQKTAVRVRFDYFYEGGEHGNFVGLDSNNNPVWIYRVGQQDNPQCATIDEIGSYKSTYYLLDLGSVTALDLKTGSILWKNTEISLSGIACTISKQGTIYLCDYLASDFFAIDSDGNMLTHIDSFVDEGYYWPISVEMDGPNVVNITFDMGPDSNYDDHIISVSFWGGTYHYQFIGGTRY